MVGDYGTHNRRRFIKGNLRKYKYGTSSQWSQRRIAMDVAEAFGLDKSPSATTIKNDLAQIEKEGLKDVSYSEEAERLLLPDNFAEWRAHFFRAPGNRPYLTPKHQQAWFHIVRALALKEEIPDWVVDYLDLEEQLEDIDIKEWVKDPKQMLTLFLLAPPRHGKSDLAAHVIIWLICRMPDIRILWCAGKLEISMLTTSFVKAELESNEELIQAYGPFENEGDWSNNQFTVATRKTRMRSPTIKAIAKGTTILSLDGDIIFADDIFDLKSSLSPAQVQKDITWLKSQLMTRREPWTPLFGIGSHQPSPTGDAYQYMDDEHDNEIHFVEQRAHDYEQCKPLEDGMVEEDRHGEWCVLWQELRPWHYLEQMRRALGDISFEVCYNQDSSQSKLEYFRAEVVRGNYPQPVVDSETGRYLDFNAYESKPGILDTHRGMGLLVRRCCGTDALRTTMGFDPAAGQSKGTSESALVVLQACSICQRRYVVDYWHKRQSPEQHPDTIAGFASRYKPHRVRIEINAYQKALARDPRLRDASLEHRFIIDEFFTGEDKVDPELGIPLLSRHMEQGRFSVPYQTIQDRHKAEALLTQLVRYPSEPNDVVMALWLADKSIQKIFEEMRWRPKQWMAGVPDHLKENAVTIDLSQPWE